MLVGDRAVPDLAHPRGFRHNHRGGAAARDETRAIGRKPASHRATERDRDGSQKDVLANPVFRRLKAVREDRVIYLDLTDQFAGALGFASVISLPYLLDESEDMFAAAVDGDPGTPITQPE
jgi:hypothetical protein